MTATIYPVGRSILLGMALAAVGSAGEPCAHAFTASLSNLTQEDEQGGGGRLAKVLVQVTDDAGNPVSEQIVVLEVHNSSQLIDELTASTEEDGAVQFTAVPTGPGFHVRPVVNYGGADYVGDPTPLPEGGDLVLPVTVYPTTTEGSLLHLDVLHLIVRVVEPGLYQVVQVMVVRNVGEAAYLGGPAAADGRRAGLVIPFPTGAVQVRPFASPQGNLDPSTLVRDGNRFLHLRPIPPGLEEVAISYELVADRSGQLVELTLPYPTQRVSLLVGGPASDRVRVDAIDLVPGDPQTIPGQGTFANWVSDVREAGSVVAFRIGPVSGGLTVQSWAMVGLSLAIFAAVAGSVLASRTQDVEHRRRQLLEQIARLDLQRENRSVSDSSYVIARSAALDELLSIEQRRSA